MNKKMIEEEKLQEWKEQAIKAQQFFYSVFGDRSWDVYQPSEHHLLEKNVGYALYGPPEAMPDKENSKTGYTKKKLEHIKKMCNLIVDWDQHAKVNNETWVAVLFVCLNENGKCQSVPVFRVPKYNPKGECSVFIDHMGRVYEGWNKFLTNNCLSKCKYCYPVDGIYCGDENYNVQLQFGDTPACKTSRKVLDALDTTNTCVAIGGTVIGLASLTALPIAAPIVAAGAISGIASFLYGTTRSVGTLVDRKSHRQSIGLDNGEARCCYMSVVAGALGMASGIGSRWVARVAQNGELVSKTGRVVVNALNISSLATNGVGIVNNFFLLHEKHKCGELSCLDVFQFTSSVLFFTSAVVNIKTANSIIKETQESTLKNFEENLAFKKHKKLYRRMTKNTIADADDPIYGKAKVIKAMRHIDDPKEFFSNINKVRRELHETNTDISFGKSGTLALNTETQVEPTQLSAVSRNQRREFLTATKDLSEGTISRTEFQSLAQQNNVPVELLCKNSATSSGADSEKKSSMKLGEIIKLAEAHMNGLLKCAISLEKADYQLLLSYAERLCRELGFNKTADVLHTLNFIIDFINTVANSMEEQYQQDLLQARERYGERFNQCTFDESYKVFGNRMRIFSTAIMNNLDKLYCTMKSVYELFLSEEVLDEHVMENCHSLVFENMPNTFSSVPKESCTFDSLSEGQSEPSCQQSKTFSDFPYFKERDFLLEGDLSDEELYEIASFLTEVPVCSANAKLLHVGSITFVSADPLTLFSCVMVISHIDDKMISAKIVS